MSRMYQTCSGLFTVNKHISQRRQWHPTPVLLPENPMDGGAWWAAVYGVAQSDTTEVTQQQQQQHISLHN